RGSDLEAEFDGRAWVVGRAEALEGGVIDEPGDVGSREVFPGEDRVILAEAAILDGREVPEELSALGDLRIVQVGRQDAAVGQIGGPLAEDHRTIFSLGGDILETGLDGERIRGSLESQQEGHGLEHEWSFPDPHPRSYSTSLPGAIPDPKTV